MVNENIRSVVIVGGGTAGWITAGTLAASFKQQTQTSIDITLVESKNIGIVGVGEGTWPTMRRTLKNMGVRETDFIKECHVSFKQGAKFAKWVTGESNDYYYHPLMLPQGFDSTSLAKHWVNEYATAAEPKTSFSRLICPQEDICERGLAPKSITTAEYDGIANYAYHLDAGKFSEFLQKHCSVKLGVKHIIDDVIAVNNNQDDEIESVSTQHHGNISGDLFIDCSGFKSLLLGEHFKIPFVSCKDTLFCDTALAAHVPYASENSPIASHTISTAQNAGWIWDIGLPTRRGVGHVYASDYLSEDEATANLLNYLSDDLASANDISIRKLNFEAGHRQKFWHKNCLAIGLSAGFLEPLEASALLLVEISASTLAEQFPTNKKAMTILSKRFNELFLYRWERIIDFLKLHYLLNKRNDHAFWRDNRKQETIPQSLQDLLQLWESQIPSDNDFMHAIEVFPSASYQYVLYGMGFKGQASPYGLSEKLNQQSINHYQKTNKYASQLVNTLEPNRALLAKIYQYGLQTI